MLHLNLSIKIKRFCEAVVDYRSPGVALAVKRGYISSNQEVRAVTRWDISACELKA